MDATFPRGWRAGPRWWRRPVWAHLTRRGGIGVRGASEERRVGRAALEERTGGGGEGCMSRVERRANYWAPLTRKRHTMPHSAQPRHTNDGAPRTRKRHQQEHWPQRPGERSNPTQHAKGRTVNCPGPHKETTTRRNVTRGGGGGWDVLEGRTGGGWRRRDQLMLLPCCCHREAGTKPRNTLCDSSSHHCHDMAL